MRSYHPSLMIMAKTIGFEYLDTTELLGVRRMGIASAARELIEAAEDEIVENPPTPMEEQEFVTLMNELERWRKNPVKKTRTKLQPDQRDAVWGQAGFRNIMSVMDHSDAQDIATYKDWYRKAHAEALQASKELAGAFDALKVEESERMRTMVGVVAATSQGTLWEENLELARAIIETTASGQKFTQKLKITDQNKSLVDQILAGNFAQLRTNKFGPFSASILDPDQTANTVVVDSHMIAMWRGARVGVQHEDFKPVNVTEQAVLTRDVIKVAQKVSLTPQSVQAVSWSVWRKLPPQYRASFLQPIEEPVHPEAELFKALYPYIFNKKDPGAKRANWRYRYKTGVDKRPAAEDPSRQQWKSIQEQIGERHMTPSEWRDIVAEYGSRLNEFYGITDECWNDFLRGDERWAEYFAYYDTMQAG